MGFASAALGLAVEDFVDLDRLEVVVAGEVGEGPALAVEFGFDLIDGQRHDGSSDGGMGKGVYRNAGSWRERCVALRVYG